MKHFLLRLSWILHYWVIFWGFLALKPSFFNFSFPLNLNVQDTMYPVFASYDFWGEIQKWSMASLRPWEIESIDLPLPCAKRLWFLKLLNLKSWHPIKVMREMSSGRTVLVLSDEPARAFFPPILDSVGIKVWWEQEPSECHAVPGAEAGPGARAWKGLLGPRTWFVGVWGRKALLPPSFSFQVPQNLKCWNLRWAFLG